jgi:hypothetical protein
MNKPLIMASLIVVASLVFMGGGIAVKVARYNECRTQFSVFYCLTQK